MINWKFVSSDENAKKKKKKRRAWVGRGGTEVPSKDALQGSLVPLGEGLSHRSRCAYWADPPANLNGWSTTSLDDPRRLVVGRSRTGS
jgi:hypothetical protein